MTTTNIDSVAPEAGQVDTPSEQSQRGDLAGYGVTTSAPPEGNPNGCALIVEVESYIRSYVTLAQTSYALVIALWVLATYIWTAFDAFPYLVVTSSTKRSGKTRLLELISFAASNSRLVANISPAALYRTIDAEKPTLLVDEAEMFSSAKSEFRSLLNTGYRRGQTVKRHDGDYETYCPKAFALIGDVHDTLRDRSIVIEMRRAEPARRFVYAAAKEEGAALREKIDATVSSRAEEVREALRSFEGLSFLTDRDEEIWSPLFILCRLICPDRIDELTRAAADISAAKTAKARRYSELGGEEDRMQEEEYAVRLLRDMLHVIGEHKQITTQEAITKLRQIPTSPWRRFRGDGLKDGIEGAMVVAGLLSRFGLKPSTIRVAPKSQGTGSTAKGYRRRALLEALNKIEQASRAGVPDDHPPGQPSKRSGDGRDYRSVFQHRGMPEEHPAGAQGEPEEGRMIDNSLLAKLGYGHFLLKPPDANISTIFAADAASMLGALDDDSVDLVITSPPYAEKRKNAYGGVPAEKYIEWFLPISAQLLRVLKPTGSFVLNIKEGTHKGERQIYVMELVAALRKQGWIWTEEYIWHKKNSFPGKWRNRFRDAWEHCYHFTKQGDFYMDQDAVRVRAAEATRMRRVGAGENASRESQTGSGLSRNMSNILGRELVYPTNVLHLATETSNNGHSAAFPVSLPEWFIRLFTKPGDLVLDPFMGSGSTAIAARMLERRYIGVEVMERHVELAALRLTKCSCKVCSTASANRHSGGRAVPD